MTPRALTHRRVLPLFFAAPLLLLLDPLEFPAIAGKLFAISSNVHPRWVRGAAVPTPWEDDAFTVGFPPAPSADDNPHRKIRVGRCPVQDRPARAAWVPGGWAGRAFPVALDILADSLLLGRPPPLGSLPSSEPGAA